MKRSLMVWGTSSGAGKSLLTAALCRWAARQGVSVAPFKAQNMSNNARVVPGLDGRWGEIGAAQFFQAHAAGVAPTVDMNPILLKPEHDTASQVLVLGEVSHALGTMPWRERSETLAQVARAAFERLHARHDLIIMEGAGSPAEINLAEQDYVNLGAARWAQASGEFRSLVVTDIDRGGAFAHLYGTWAMLPTDLRSSLSGFVLNKFRGDASLLAPGPQTLEAMTGVPVAGVLPMLRHHGLPDEDGVYDFGGEAAAGEQRVAIVAYPHLSNLDEFELLRQLQGWRVVWARTAADVASAAWVILPGSKQTGADLQWLHAQGMAAALHRHVAAGRPLLGICGGLQMLGEVLDDPQGWDGPAGLHRGLGLLPLKTHYEWPKRVWQMDARWGALSGRWQPWAGQAAPGYEIRVGRTHLTGQGTSSGAGPHDRQPCQPVMWDRTGAPMAWQQGSVLGVYAHGLLESPALVAALWGEQVTPWQHRLDELADHLDAHLDKDWLSRCIGR